MPPARLIAVQVCILISLAPLFLRADENATVPLTSAGKPVLAVVVADSGSTLLMSRAAETIADTVLKWSGVRLPIVGLDDRVATLSAGPAVILTTLDRLRELDPSLEMNPATDSFHTTVTRVGCLDEHGFACVPRRAADGATQLFVVGRTPRGVYNGAVFVRDFCIDGPRDRLFLQAKARVRSPKMPARGAYMLTFWADEINYTADDWMKILDACARDGMERVYFWTSGHFPSRKYPNTVLASSRISTLDALHRIIRHAHELGIKFYLGSGVFGWTNAIELTRDHPETYQPSTTHPDQALAPCPSHPLVRKRLLEYIVEMADSLPEADGLFLETRDEYGACACPTCQKVIDSHGSKQYCQAELSMLAEIAPAVWRHCPHMRIAWCPPLGSTNYNDRAYYETLRQFNDPRLEWMDSNGNWAMPGPDGRPWPLVSVSRHVTHDNIFCSWTLDQLVKESSRITHDGLYGYIGAFLHGCAKGDWENYKQVPYPTDWMPYVVSGFAFREMTWEPAQNLDDLRALIAQRFFGQEAPAQLASDLCALRDLYAVHSTANMPNLRELPEGAVASLAQIEEHIRQAEPNAGPKTLETLALMRRAIADTRSHFKIGAARRDSVDTIAQ